MNKRVSSSPIELPRGVRDFLPERAARMRRIEDILNSVFDLWGYRRVITPTIEYLDVLALAEPELLERMFKFEDRTSGKVLAIRADMTAQIARLAATHLKDRPKPLRLRYSGSVLHYGDAFSHGGREIYQAGLEHMGANLSGADGEVIAVAIEAIRSTGLEDFRIDVGQIEFFRGVMEGLELTGELRSRVEKAVSRKDRSGIEALLPSLKLKRGDEELLLALPTLFGNREAIERAGSLNLSPRSKKAIDNLSKVLDTIESYGLIDYITVDLGEIRGLNYYSGVIFEGFVRGWGEPVCGGGRYDTLLGLYGYDLPATGFAINIGSLLDALERREIRNGAASNGYLIVNRRPATTDALKLARFLRSSGVRAVEEIIDRDIEESLTYAAETGLKGVIIVGAEGSADNEIELRRPDDREGRRLLLQDVLEGKTVI